jgi:YVTN family beta-propeller protein
VSNAAVDTLSLIDTRTDTVISTVPVGKAPLGLGLDLTGSRLFVAHALDDRVALLDPATGATTRALEVGRTPVAFGPFIGVVANACPRAALECDDADPFTADACAAPGGCRHTLRRGLDAVGAGLAALGDTVRRAPAGTFRRAPVASALAGFLAKAEALVAPGLPANPRLARRQQAGLNRFLRRFSGLARKGYRSGTIARDTGARLVDLAGATGAALRELRGTQRVSGARPASVTREIVPPPLGGPATKGR